MHSKERKTVWIFVLSSAAVVVADTEYYCQDCTISVHRNLYSKITIEQLIPFRNINMNVQCTTPYHRIYQVTEAIAGWLQYRVNSD